MCVCVQLDAFVLKNKNNIRKPADGDPGRRFSRHRFRGDFGRRKSLLGPAVTTSTTAQTMIVCITIYIYNTAYFVNIVYHTIVYYYYYYIITRGTWPVARRRSSFCPPLSAFPFFPFEKRENANCVNARPEETTTTNLSCARASLGRGCLTRRSSVLHNSTSISLLSCAPRFSLLLLFIPSACFFPRTSGPGVVTKSRRKLIIFREHNNNTVCPPGKCVSARVNYPDHRE